MKKFILEILLFSVLIFISGYILYQLNIPSPLANRISKIDGKLDILNLGTSHGNDFNYDYCPKNGANISKAGNTLYYDLQNYIYLNKNDYLTENAIILIPVSYYVFGLDENRSDRLPNSSFVNEFYYYLDKDQIFSYSDQKNRNLMVLNIQKNFKNLFSNEENENEDKASTDSELKKHAQTRVKNHKRLSNFSSTAKNITYLDSLLKEIIKNNHTPILVTTPFYYSYNENFGKDWLDKNYYKIVTQFSAKYKIQYLDYSHDTRFSSNAKYFYNSDHLNTEGKKIFSEIIFKEALSL